jgi:GNAT superfamily N-acetyltransferase
VKTEWLLRLAREDDVPAIEALIPLSVRGLQSSHYSAAQMEAAIGSVFGVDRQLICDGTYFVVEGPPSVAAATSSAAGENELIGCGGWSKRKTLFGSDHQTNRDDAEQDPATEPARIRAFFIHPNHARCGIGRAILEECEKAIRAAAFKRIELAATLPGVPFYAACGYSSGERSDVPLTNELSLPIVRMTKRVEG